MTTQTPAQIADLWAQRSAQAVERTKAGVMAVTVNPMERAAARADAYLAGVTRAVADGSYQRGLLSVSLQDWKESMIEKGIPRIASGVNAAKTKFATFMGELMTHIGGIQRQLEGMPRGDLEANLQRMNFNARAMAEFRRSNR